MTRLALVLVLVLGVAMVLPTFAAEKRLALTGAVGYSLPLEFDHDRDGDLDKVQFWVDFDVKAAVGEPGTPDHVPATGTLGYYMLILDTGEKIWNWMDLFMGQMPRKRRHDVSKIVFKGDMAGFEAVGMSWVVKDGGPGFKKDRVQVKVRSAVRQFKLQAGGVDIGPIPEESSEGGPERRPRADGPIR